MNHYKGREKKIKKAPQAKKAPKSPEFVDTDSDDTDDELGPAVKCMVIYSAEDEQEPTVKKSSNEQLPPQDDKEHSLLGMKEEAQSFFDLQMESKNLTIEKKVEEVVFMAGPCKGYELSYVALCGTKYLKWVLKMSRLEKKTKDLIKQALAKT